MTILGVNSFMVILGRAIQRDLRTVSFRGHSSAKKTHPAVAGLL